MKFYYGIMLVALAAIITFWPAQQARAQAGDTLLVEWEESPDVPLVNALRTAIANDTNRPAVFTSSREVGSTGSLTP